MKTKDIQKPVVLTIPISVTDLIPLTKKHIENNFMDSLDEGQQVQITSKSLFSKTKVIHTFTVEGCHLNDSDTAEGIDDNDFAFDIEITNVPALLNKMLDSLEESSSEELVEGRKIIVKYSGDSKKRIATLKYVDGEFQFATKAGLIA